MQENYNIQNTNNIFNAFSQFEKTQNKSMDFYLKQQNPPKDEVKIKSDKKTKTIASSILTAGVIGLLIAKGLHGSSIKSLSNKLSEVGSTSTRTTVYYAKKGTDRTLNALQATSNFTTIKDTIFDKIFNSNSLTAKYAQAARKFAGSVIDKTLGKQYDKAGMHINDVVTLIKQACIPNIENLDKTKKIIIKGEEKTLGEWVNLLKDGTQKLQNSFDENFSLGARKVRSIERDKSLEGTKAAIDEKLFKNGGWHNIENYKTYITEEVTRNAQQVLKDKIVTARKTVTNNIDSIHNEIKSSLFDLKLSIKPKDKANSEILDSVAKELEKFKTCSGETENQARLEISNKMIGYLDDTLQNISKNKIYAKEEQTELINQIEMIKSQIQLAQNDSKGSLENIMTILKGLNSATLKNGQEKIISDIDYKKFEKLSKNISTELKEATDKEMGEYFLKQAELVVGSAATDVFSLIFPIGVGAYAIGKCDNKDERISSALKTCIPLVGTFATFVYGTTKMFSGAKSLIFSSVSGFALNKTGTYLDNLYQNYKKSGSVVQVAKGEYDNVWSDLSVGLNGKNK